MNQVIQSLGPFRRSSSRLVSREMLQARTVELAAQAGRSAHEIKQIDYERAKRELTGESNFDRQQARLEETVRS